MLQTSRPRTQPTPSDPVRTGLLVAAACATLLVACVAVNALLSNNPQEVVPLQAPR